MRPRKMLLILTGSLMACLLICVAVAFFSLRGIRSSVQGGVQDGMATVASEQLAVLGAPEPGTYTITSDDILQRINERLAEEDADVNDLVVRIESNNTFDVGFSTSSQDFTYSGTFGAVDGRLVVSDMEANNSVMNFLMPGGKLAAGIEDGINTYLDENDLVLLGVTSVPGAFTFEIVPA